MTKKFTTMGKLENLKLSSKKTLSTFLIFALILTSAKTLLSTSPKISEKISFSQAVYDESGELLRLTLSADEKYRIWTPLAEISPKYVEATLLLEDQYFFKHFGINPVSLMKATIGYISGHSKNGASTITMQLARLQYRLRTRTPWGKFIQILHALKIEASHSKKEILEAYLNLVPFGGSLEGVGSASFVYFDKKPKNLSLSESLSLAVIPQSPNKRRLSSAKTKLNNADPKKRLLTKWIHKHPEDAERILDIKLPLYSKDLRKLPFEAPHFSNWILKNSNAPLIKTSLNLKLQKQIEQKVRSYIDSKESMGVKNATVLLVDHDSSEIKAYIGSKDFFDRDIQGQVDGIQAKRSPGSALKPFVYALGFEQGHIHQESLLKDTPLQYASYDPENFDQKFLGPISAEQALITSRNVPAVWLSQKLKEPDLFSFLKAADIYFPNNASYYGLSLVLGATEISPLEMAGLYSALANHGLYKKVTWKKYGLQAGKRILSPESSFLTLDSLTRSKRPRFKSRNDWFSRSTPIAWKTGTSHGYRDAWTAGLVGKYTLVVWLGNFNNRSNQELIGLKAAAPLFFQIADGLSADLKNNTTQPKWLKRHDVELVKAHVCSVSGALPAPECEHTKEIWYNPGHSPIAKCKIHRSIVISAKTGLRKCSPPDSDDKSIVYEFWPSDLKHLFVKAGIKRLEPPAFEASCGLEERSLSGIAPEIKSPIAGVTYLKSLSSKKDSSALNFEAISDSDAKELHWFVDKEYIGKSKSSEVLSFHPKGSGTFLLTVVDDLGRSDQRKISLKITE